jgi:hypothetical protein
MLLMTFHLFLDYTRVQLCIVSKDSIQVIAVTKYRLANTCLRKMHVSVPSQILINLRIFSQGALRYSAASRDIVTAFSICKTVMWGENPPHPPPWTTYGLFSICIKFDIYLRSNGE